MKILKIYFILFVCLSDTAIGQYFHFPDSNAVWSVYDEKYYIQGDSVLNSFIYNKYFLSHDSTMTTGSFFALVREDTITKRIFAISSGSENEKLIYDFSLNPGDTCTVYPLSFSAHSGPIKVKIDQIDSILIAGQFRQRKKITGIYPNYTLPEHWIEGIGSTFGIFNSGIGVLHYADIYYPVLLCFEQNGAVLFDNPDFNDCYEHYPIGIMENEDPEYLRIYPNPGTDKLYISPSNTYIKFEMMNMNGQKVLERSVNKNNNYINIEFLESGIYFYRLHDSNMQNIVYGKWIKK